MFRIVLLIFSYLLFAVGNTFSQTSQNWRSQASDNIWQTFGNWWNPGESAVLSNTQLIWNNNHELAQINNANLNTWRFLFQSGADQIHTFSGNSVRFFDFNDQHPAIINQSSAVHTLEFNLEGDGDLGDPLEIIIDNAGLTISGNINNQGSFIDVIGSTSTAETLQISGQISGSGGLFVNNSNLTVSLSGPNDYTGNNILSNGIVSVESISGLGISNTTTVNSGGTLQLNIPGISSLSFPVNISGNGNGGIGALRKIDGNRDEFAGTLTLASDARVVCEGGELRFDGTVNLSSHTLRIGGSAIVSIDNGSTFLNVDKISDEGAIYKEGSGRLEMRPKSSMTGNITLNDGEIWQMRDDPYPNTGLLIFQAGAYKSSSTASRTIEKPVRVDGDFELGEETIRTGSLIFQSSFDLNSLGAPHQITMDNNNEIQGIITGASFIKAGSGTLTISGNSPNTLGDGSSVNEGLLVLNKAAGQRATGGIQINAGGTVRTDANNQWGTSSPPFIQIFGGTLDLNNTDQRLALAGDASASVTLGSGNITIDGTGTDTFAGVISGSGGVTKEGTGTEILTGSNVYTGSTTITEGTLQLEAFNTLPPSSPIVFNGGTLRSTDAVGSSTFGTIELAESSTLDLGGTSEILNFQISSGIAWNTDATLTILGWAGSAEQPGANSKIFFPNASALTEDQLLRIQFDGPYDFGATLILSGAVYELVPKVQNVLRFDDFNRAVNNTLGNTSSGLGGTWIETEVMSGCPLTGDYIRIDSEGRLQLRNTGSSCAGGASGEKLAAIDISGLYATQYEVADSLMEWYFNLRQNLADPSGANRTAYIIGSTLSDFSTGSGAEGYAVVIGESGNPDNIHLIYFDDGMPNSTSLGAVSIVSIPVSSEENAFSIKVTFDPCTDEWTMAVRDDGADFKDPASISSAGSTSSNTTHVDKDLIYLGVYRNHSAGAGQESFFDNIYIPSAAPSSNTYTWNGSVDDDYQHPNNWSPRRSCTKPNDLIVFSLSADETVVNVPDETIGGLDITGNFELTLKDISGDGTTSAIVVRNGNVNLSAQSTIILDVDNSSNFNDGVEISIIGSGAAQLNGNIIVRNSIDGAARPHRILGEVAGAIQVNGTIRVEDLTGNLFGDSGMSDIVEFNFGSVYECLDGPNPFALTQPSSKVIFEEGSLYRYLNTDASLSLGGRTYADFEYSASGATTIGFASSADWSVDNLRILSGLLNISPPNDDGFDINCSGDFEIQGTLNINPADTITLTLNGNGSQRIFGSGTLDLTSSVIFRIDNSSSTETVELEKDLTVFNDFELLSGELQGNGATLTMAGQNHFLRVEDDLIGEVSGANDEINLIIADSTTLVGTSSICDFLNITINANIPFSLERGIRCVNGTFSVQNDAQLVLSAGGFIGASSGYRSPTYQPGSFLVYESGGFYSRSVEWNSLSGAGYPENVIITNSTTLLPAANSNSTTDFGLQGDLLIESTSHLDMSNSNNDNMNVP
jgi:autotransporter-associated beta strand protein